MNDYSEDTQSTQIVAWPPDLPDVDRLLQEARILNCRPLPWGSNYVFLARLDGGKAGETLAVYKPRAGEAPLYDFPGGTLYQREYAAYVVSEALGWRLVPPTVIRDDGPHGVGTMQLYIITQPGADYTTWHDERIEDLQRVALFDLMTNNADRKGSHCLLGTDNHLWCIDHGITFNYEDKLRTVVWDFRSTPIPEPLLSDIEAFYGKATSENAISDRLRTLISPMEYRALLKRTEQLLLKRTFPEPPAHRRAVPWPPM